MGHQRPGGQEVPLEALRARVAAMIAAHCRCDRPGEVGAALAVLVRNSTRDYLDVVALADQLGGAATQLAKQLAEPAPYDLDAIDLQQYRELTPRWREWSAVASACGELAVAILDAAARAGHRL